eukprot:2023654-Pyramimonas_sp.AAC.1
MVAEYRSLLKLLAARWVSVVVYYALFVHEEGSVVELLLSGGHLAHGEDVLAQHGYDVAAVAVRPAAATDVVQAATDDAERADRRIAQNAVIKHCEGCERQHVKLHDHPDTHI